MTREVEAWWWINYYAMAGKPSQRQECNFFNGVGVAVVVAFVVVVAVAVGVAFAVADGGGFSFRATLG